MALHATPPSPIITDCSLGLAVRLWSVLPRSVGKQFVEAAKAMRITWADVGKGLLGLAGLVIVGWAGWLSLTVIDVKTQVVEVGSKVDGIDLKVSGVDGRVTRISNRLPTEIALHTQELYNREIKTAVIAGLAMFADGLWTRHVAVYDQAKKLLKSFPVPVRSPTDDEWLRGFLWRVSSYDESTIRFSVLEDFRERYNVEAPRIPGFVDANHSVLSSKDFDEIVSLLQNQYDQRLTMRMTVPKPEVQHLPAGTRTYRHLATELLHHEAVFRP